MAVVLFLIVFAVFVFLRIQSGFFAVGPDDCNNPDRLSVRGTVIDSATGEPIVSADVALEGEGYLVNCTGRYARTIEHHVNTDEEGAFSVLALYWPSTPLQFTVNAPNCEQYVALKSLRDMEAGNHNEYMVQISLTCQHSGLQIQNRSVLDPNR